MLGRVLLYLYYPITHIIIAADYIIIAAITWQQTGETYSDLFDSHFLVMKQQHFELQAPGHNAT